MVAGRELLLERIERLPPLRAIVGDRGYRGLAALAERRGMAGGGLRRLPRLARGHLTSSRRGGSREPREGLLLATALVQPDIDSGEHPIGRCQLRPSTAWDMEQESPDQNVDPRRPLLDRCEIVPEKVVGDLPAHDRALDIGRPEVDAAPDPGVEDLFQRSEKREKLRDVCELLLNALKATLSVPKNARSVVKIAPASQLWPDGWSGKAGVASSGVQFGSATVAGLPSVSASRIAWGPGDEAMYENPMWSPTGDRIAFIWSWIRQGFGESGSGFGAEREW